MTTGQRSARVAMPPGVQIAAGEVTLHLERLRDLFGSPALDAFGGSAGLPSGIERLVTALLGQRRPETYRVVVVVSDPPITPSLDSEIRASIAAYCDVKSDDLHRRRAALRHEGFSALWFSGPLLLVALLLATVVAHSGIPDFWSSYLSDGLLLVLAWVALWYPLDTLLWYGRPLKHEWAVLQHLRRMDIAVRGRAQP